jgi:hypothetical protein
MIFHRGISPAPALRLPTFLGTLLLVGLLLACLMLEGCSGPARGRGPGGRDGRSNMPILPAQQIFFSPFGEPFRAPPEAAYPVTQWFAKADANGDGAIDAQEFAADGRAFFVLLDGNKDARLDAHEINLYESEIAPEILGRAGKAREMLQGGEKQDDADKKEGEGVGRGERRKGMEGGGGGMRRGPPMQRDEGATAFSLLRIPQHLRAADSNLDFSVSAQEWESATTTRFQALDKNGDGRLKADELPKTLLQERFGK